MRKTMRTIALISMFLVLLHSKEADSQSAGKAAASNGGNSVINSIKNLLGDQAPAMVLRFSSLGAWHYGGNPPFPPQPLLQLNGRMVKIAGFMYPLEEGKLIKVFCLLRSTQTCCYGPKPQFNQYVFVEMNAPVKPERNKSLIITGKFFVDPKPEDGYIYRMEGVKIEAAAEPQPQTKLANTGVTAKNLVFDFAALEAMEPPEEVLANINSWSDYPEIKKFPENILCQEGKTVTAEGYIVARTGDPRKVILGKYWWDGCCQGTPPTFFNAVVILLKKNEKPPDEWQETSIFTGTLRTNKDKSKWPQIGVIRLENAVVGGPKPS